MSRRTLASSAFVFVLTMGVVNLFADMTYEGGASINGPFMASLGAGAAAISVVAGLGEFLGYGLRSIFGYIADRTGRYWLITFIGFGVNLLAVPAMALAHSWQVAGALILVERIGRAIRKPSVDAMLSYSTGKHGRGWVYAVNTAMDETGATLGPLLIALVLFLKGGFRTGYAILLATALCTFAALAVARLRFPVPSRLEQGGPKTAEVGSFTRAYWLYMIGGAFFAAGLMSFELISFHFAQSAVVTGHWIPAFLGLATFVGVLASLVLGRLYDRRGLAAVVAGVVLSAGFSPLVFLGGFWVALVGLFLWGVGYATQDTLLKAMIAGVLPLGRRNFAFGLFYVGYGLGWLVGSIATGLLYGHSRTGLIVFAALVQLGSLPFFVLAHRSARQTSV